MKGFVEMWKMAYFPAVAFAALSTQAVPVHSAVHGAQESQFRRGVNILGHDPFWKDPASARFQVKHFAEIRRGGFDFVRVNLFVFVRMDAQNRIDPEWLKRLDWVLANATMAGLGVILDVHDFAACSKDVAKCQVKLPAAWRQLAKRYSGEPSSVAFELLNEPYGDLDAETWNEMIAELLSIVRATNPTRTIIIGPTKWNNPGMLPTLRLPSDDRHILVTFHYYGPFRFTHQGARWTNLKELRGVTWGNDADRVTLRERFEWIGAWARTNQRPILLGEFGAYDKSGTPIDMRAAYVAAVACEAERQGFGWAYWQFDGNFIAWDMKRDSWVQPIKDALIPPTARPASC